MVSSILNNALMKSLNLFTVYYLNKIKFSTMAGNAEERLSIEQRQLNRGHRIHFKVSRPNLASLLNRPLRCDFTTACDVLPISWKFDLVYQEVTEENELSFSVALIRDDSLDNKVRADISVVICNTLHHPYFASKFQKDEMCPGDEIKENVSKLAINPLLRVLRNQEIVVQVVINILDCHSPLDYL